MRRIPWRLLAVLAVVAARAIRAVKFEGLSVQEAALRQARSRSWIKVNVHRGLKAMAMHAAAWPVRRVPCVHGC